MNTTRPHGRKTCICVRLRPPLPRARVAVGAAPSLPCCYGTHQWEIRTPEYAWRVSFTAGGGILPGRFDCASRGPSQPAATPAMPHGHTSTLALCNDVPFGTTIHRDRALFAHEIAVHTQRPHRDRDASKTPAGPSLVYAICGELRLRTPEGCSADVRPARCAASLRGSPSHTHLAC